MSGERVLREGWWRPLPGIVAAGVLFGFVFNAAAGIAVAAAGWAAAIAFPVLFVRADGTGAYRRRAWRDR